MRALCWAMKKSNNLQHRVNLVRKKLTSVCNTSGRDIDGVKLMAVSKTREPDEIRQAYELGLRDFGENFLQEAKLKTSELHDIKDIIWHFIGKIQSNKAHDIGTLFDWVHTLDRTKIADRLDRARDHQKLPLNVCIQVNIDQEKQKSGVLPDELRNMVDYVNKLPRLKLRGLMAIPSVDVSSERNRESFSKMHALFKTYRKIVGPHWDTLSMGMSADYVNAIYEGSTIIRVGTAIFGRRKVNRHTGRPSND